MQTKEQTTQFATSSGLRLGIRFTRVLAVLRAVITIIIVIALTITALATLDNALAPAVQLTHASRGPEALSVVRALAYDQSSGALYSASNAGVFKSVDGGVNWSPVNRGLSGVDAQDLLLDQKTGDIYAVMFGIGLFRSTDGGQNWSNISRGFRGSELLTVAYDDRIGVLYAGLRGYGMWTSNDGGQSWQTIGMGLVNLNIRQLVVGRKPGEIFAASDQGVYHSTEVTGEWELLTPRSQPANTYALALNAEDGTLYAGTEQGVLKIEEFSDRFMVNLTGMTSGSVQALQLDANSGELFAGTLTGVYRSVDQAQTWTQLNNGLGSTLVRALLLTPEGEALIAGTDSGIYRTTNNGADWQASSTNPAARHVQAMMVDQVNGNLYAGTLGGGVFLSENDGKEWTPVNNGLRATVIQALGMDHGINVMYAGTRNGMYRSSLSNPSWTRGEWRTENEDVVSMAVDERKGAAYAVNANGFLLRTSDGGRAWDVVQPLTNLFVRAVAVSSFSSAVYVGAYRGNVLVSTDGGFNYRRAGAELPDRNVETLAVDERNGMVYAGTLSGNVFGLTVGNSEWKQMGRGLPGNVVALAVEGRSSTLFAALKAGIFRLGPGDSNWQLVTNGMAHTDIMSLAVRDSDGAVFAGTMAGGAYRSNGTAEMWEPVSAGLSDIDMRGIAVDDAAELVTVNATGRGTYRYNLPDQSWQVANIGVNEMSAQALATQGASARTTLITTRNQYHAQGNSAWTVAPWTLDGLLDLFLPINSYGFVGMLPGGEMLWAARGGSEVWARTAAGSGLINATIQQLPQGQGRILAVWGAELTQTEPGAQYGRVPLAWMTVRMWYWEEFIRLAAIAPWWWVVPVVVALLLLATVILSRRRLVRVYGVPARVAYLTPQRSAEVAKPDALDKAWVRWERSVRSELFAHGDVKSMDLLTIPAPFRKYAMQRFATSYSDRQSIVFDGTTLHARAREQMSKWVQGWHTMRADLRRQGAQWQNRKRMEPLIRSFCAVMDLQPQEPVDNGSVRCFSTTALTSAKHNLPALAVLFVADNESLQTTVKNIQAALDALRAPETVGLVIPVGRPGRNVDITIQLRNAMQEFGASNRLVALSGGDVVNIMAAGDPVEALTARLPR